MDSENTIIDLSPEKYMDRRTRSRIKSHAMQKVRHYQAIQASKTARMVSTAASLEIYER